MEKRGYDISVCCPAVHFLSGNVNEYCDSAQRCHGVFYEREILMRNCANFSFFHLEFSSDVFMKKAQFSKGVGGFFFFATDEDKPLQTLYSEALTA